MFGALGLDDLQTRLYDELLDVSEASEPALAERLGLSVPQVRTGLASLQSMGLVSRSGLRPEQVCAAPPDVGLGSLLAERRAALSEAERVIPALMSRYRAVVGGRHGADVIDAVHGAEAVEHRIAQLRRGVRCELLTVALPRAGGPDAPVHPALGTGPTDRAVRHRVVIPRSWLEQPGSLDAVDDSSRRGELVRVVDSVPLRLVVADHELAVVALHDPGDGEDPDALGALLVRPSSLLDGLVTLFELLWRHGHSLATGPDTGQSPQPPGAPAHGPLSHELDRKVLVLLLAGLTDQSIGRQLGLSLRTVQRRARSLMDSAGVTTRLQLGYEAARRGWV